MEGLNSYKDCTHPVASLHTDSVKPESTVLTPIYGLAVLTDHDPSDSVRESLCMISIGLTLLRLR
jgi:hypothetical protein